MGTKACERCAQVTAAFRRKGLPTEECHCNGCGRHFGSPSAFDRHQRWGAPDGGRARVSCLDPEGLAGWRRLRLDGRGVWITGGGRHQVAAREPAHSPNPFAASTPRMEPQEAA